jgi:Transposase DDE domain
MRVRASAGSGSFRRLQTLERFRAEARARVAALRQELEADPSACSARRKAARERAVRERLERVEEALRQYPEVHAQKKHAKDKTRVSVTDPDARKMHMPDGGFRPAVNVQFTTDTGSQVIVGTAVIQSGSDGGQLRPAVEQVKTRYEKTPSEMLTDGGFAKKEDVEALAKNAAPCTVYAPWPEHKTAEGQVIGPQPEDSLEVQQWYERMQTPEAKELYKDRAATAECVNALARNRGMQQFLVRGVQKIRSVVLLFVLVQNLLRGEVLLEGGWESAPRTASPNSVAAYDERSLPIVNPSVDVPDEAPRGLPSEDAGAKAATKCLVNTS